MKPERLFKSRNKEQSAAAHTPESIAHSVHEDHGGPAPSISVTWSMVVLMGSLPPFAVVSGVAGAELRSGIILIMGLANLLADGFSMATGAYISAKSEQEYYEKEYQRELWEIEEFPDGERLELLEIYCQEGYSEEEAEQLTEIKTRTKERWVDAMMKDELGMLKDEKNPVFSGLATLVAFLVAGVMPLLVYLIGLAFPTALESAFLISIVLSGLSLFGVGAAKVLVTQQNPYKSGFRDAVGWWTGGWGRLQRWYAAEGIWDWIEH